MRLRWCLLLHTFRAASLGAQGYLPGEPNNRGSWKQNNIQFVHSPATPPPPAIGPCTPVVTLTGPNPLANLGPPFAAAPACDTRTLPARIAELESVCGDGSACDLGCATLLLPLLDDCRPLLDRLCEPANTQPFCRLWCQSSSLQDGGHWLKPELHAAATGAVHDCFVAMRSDDGVDGVEDGEAAIFSTARAGCLAIPKTTLVGYLADLHEQVRLSPIDAIHPTRIQACTGT